MQVKLYNYFDINLTFGCCCVKKGKTLNNSNSEELVEETRRQLLYISKAELFHFKSLRCQHTFIKSYPETVSNSICFDLKKNTSIQKKNLKSQKSTLGCSNESDSLGENNSPSVSDDDSESVSSNDQRNSDDDDFVDLNFPLKKGEKVKYAKSNKSKSIEEIDDD